MLHFCSIFLLSLFFAYTISNNIQNNYSNRTIASSRSIYDLVQLRRQAARLAAYYNRTHRNTIFPIITTPNNQMIGGNRFLMDRLKIIIIIISVPMIFMILIVIVCVIRRYYQGKNPKPTERIEQAKPLNSSRSRNRYTGFSGTKDTRNFSRKSRRLPIVV